MPYSQYEIKPQFTDGASQALHDLSAELATELRDRAIEEALRTRGEPVEVTASDVLRARYQQSHEIRVSRVSSSTSTLFRLYFYVGILTAIIGFTYPFLSGYIKTIELTQDERLSLMLGLTGLVTSVLSYVFMNRMNRRRTEIQEHDRVRAASLSATWDGRAHSSNSNDQPHNPPLQADEGR